MDKKDSETIDIQKTVIGKHYNLEVIQSNRYLELAQKMSPYNLEGIALKNI